MISESVARKLEEMAHLIAEQQFDTEFVDLKTVILRGYLRFIDGSLLHFMEYTGPETHDYRFQYMDENKNLIRRWDNAPHYRNLKNFPFHVHTPEDVEPSSEITLSRVLEKVKGLILDRIED